MKNKLWLGLIGLMLATALLAGCGIQSISVEGTLAPAATATVAPEATALQTAAEPTPAQSVASGKTITPLSATLDVANLKDCTFAAGFAASDISLNEDGALVVHMTVYDYEQYDMIDVNTLAVGDTIVINGSNVVITTLDNANDGRVQINGGMDQDGYTLATDENGIYFVLDFDDAKQYSALGEAVLPVDQDFTMTDGADPEQPGREYLAGDFLTDMAAGDRTFSPNNTTVTVMGGYIININVTYMP